MTAIHHYSNIIYCSRELFSFKPSCICCTIEWCNHIYIYIKSFDTVVPFIKTINGVSDHHCTRIKKSKYLKAPLIHNPHTPLQYLFNASACTYPRRHQECHHIGSSIHTLYPCIFFQLHVNYGAYSIL